MNEVRHKATLVCECGDDLPLVRGDESQLVQVVVNLIVNAAHASRRGEPNQIVARCARVDSIAYFEVQDTGSGMSQEVVDWVFEPFYTTKASGVGTGLGLSISHGIITALGGKISIDTTPGEGTCVRVELPAATAMVDEAGVIEDAESESLPPARILLVDDEPTVGRALGRILRPNTVLLEVEPQRALARLRDGEPVDVIVCDVMMPVMTGPEFYGAVAEIRPDPLGRIVFVTGGVFYEHAHEFLERINARVLTKPVDANELRAAVAEIMATS